MAVQVSWPVVRVPVLSNATARQPARESITDAPFNRIPLTGKAKNGEGFAEPLWDRGAEVGREGATKDITEARTCGRGQAKRTPQKSRQGSVGITREDGAGG